MIDSDLPKNKIKKDNSHLGLNKKFSVLLMILLQKYIANDFSIKMHCKYFYYKSALLMIL